MKREQAEREAKEKKLAEKEAAAAAAAAALPAASADSYEAPAGEATKAEVSPRKVEPAQLSPRAMEKPAQASAPPPASPGAGAVVSPRSMEEAKKKSFGAILHALVNKWRETEPKLSMKDFAGILEGMKFSADVAVQMFETLERDSDKKVLATDIQGCFATSLCLLNISIGDLGKRATLGLNWARVKTPQHLNRREATKFAFSFVYLGAHILAVITEKKVDWINKHDIHNLVKKLFEQADTDNDDQVTYGQLSEWFGQADAEVEFLRKLSDDIKAFHGPKS